MVTTSPAYASEERAAKTVVRVKRWMTADSGRNSKWSATR